MTRSSHDEACSGTGLTTGAHLARALRFEGVETVYGIPGTHNLGIFAQLDAEGITVVTPRHEQGAAYMADGAARVSGAPQVVVTTTGPAVLNALSAVLQAYSDSVPVLLVSPGMPTSHPGRGNGLLHEVRDQSAAIAAVIGESHRVTTPGEAALAVGQAFTQMRSGRPRPVHIEIPLDLVDAPGPGNRHPAVSVGRAPADPAAVTAAAGALAAAERPLVVLGAGATGAGAQACAVADMLGAGVVASSNGKGIVGDSQACCLGAIGFLPLLPELMADADAVLAIGTELASSDFWPEVLPLPATVVRVDIDPIQMLTNAVVSHPLVGDAALTSAALLDEVGRIRAGTDTARAREWTSGWRARARTQAEEEGRPWRGLTSALNALSASLVAHTPMYVAGDSTMSCYHGVQTGWWTRAGDRLLYPAGAGTLGYGLPAGIGAKLREPDACVVVVEGDGGAMFTIQELATAVELGLTLPLVIVDNGGYGEIRNEMADRGDPPTSVALRGPDFPALARAMGAAGVHVSSARELEGELFAALARGGPTLIHMFEDSRAAAGLLAGGSRPSPDD